MWLFIQGWNSTNKSNIIYFNILFYHFTYKLILILFFLAIKSNISKKWNIVLTNRKEERL